MLGLAIFGILAIVYLLAAWSTDRIDNYWRSRSRVLRPELPSSRREVLVQFEDINETRRQRAAMRVYRLDCAGCHMDDLPLDFNGLCPVCGELKAICG